MPLNLNEIRAATEHLVARWEDILKSETVSEDSHTHLFYADFFEALGLGKERAIKYENRAKDMRSGTTKFMDIFWPSKLLVEQKSPHKDLDKAEKQALDYIPLLTNRRDWPEYVLVSDFRVFRLLKLDKGKLMPEVEQRWSFSLGELAGKLDLFGFMTGYQRVSFAEQPPVNRKAAELMANLHDGLAETGFNGHQLEVFLVRLLFCLFADDTGLFRQPDVMKDYLEGNTRPTGEDTGPALSKLFQVLDTPEDERGNLRPEILRVLPYVNGGLFSENLRMPDFSKLAHEQLLDACAFNWREVSPAVFGSLFQTVMQPKQRRQLGAHYTAENNILKVINGLFMDELRERFDKIRNNKPRLKEFHLELAEMRMLDPACGCGNFLLLAYRELRELEVEVIKALNILPNGQLAQVIDVSLLSRLHVDQFYGFEIEEFPARIAEVAMYLVDHQMNLKLSGLFGKYFERLPLTKIAHITLGNALELDWADEVPVDKLTFILGNPPFVGKHLMTEKQTEEIDKVFSDVRGNGVLDYVTGWYGKAAALMKVNPAIRTAFVSTNSICQGEQVGVLWGHLLKEGFHIHFAHRTFAWTSEARGRAAVYCIIVGFGLEESEQPLLFEYAELKGQPHALKVRNISPYLTEGPNVVVQKATKSLSSYPDMMFGSKPVDDGNYLFTDSEREEFLRLEPKAENLFRPINSAEEFLNGRNRWCLWLKDALPTVLRSLPHVMERIEKVKRFRLTSKKKPTREAADRALEFAEIRQPNSNYLLFPRVSSENRHYIPIGFFPPNYIVSDGCICLPHATPYHFGVLTSAMHMAWVKTIGGRLKSDYRYSNQLCYNPYPWPSVTKAQQERIEELAQKVLEARAAHPQATLADLYDPLTMPANLRKAHHELDKAVDATYRKEPFKSEAARVAYLLGEYQKLEEPLSAAMAKPKRNVRTRKK